MDTEGPHELIFNQPPPASVAAPPAAAAAATDQVQQQQQQQGEGGNDEVEEGAEELPPVIQDILFNLGAFCKLLSLYCWISQAQGMPELQHRCEANNPTTVQDVFLQAICCWDHHPSNQHMLERRETSSCQLWRVPLLASFVVPHSNNQWFRTHGFFVNG